MQEDIHTPSHLVVGGRRVEIAKFLIIAFGFSWVIWIATLLVIPRFGTAAIMVGAFGPAIAALAMVRHSGGSSFGWLVSTLRPRVGMRWYAFAFAVPLVIVAVQTLVASLIGIAVTFDDLGARLLTFVLTAFVVFFVGGGQEEPGWRGWLQPKLQERADPLATSVMIGTVWAAWHLPLFVLEFEMYAEFRFWLYLPTLIGLAVIYTYLWNRTRGSVIVAMVLHAAINASSSLLPVDENFASSLDLSFLAQLTMAAVVGIFAAALVIRHGRHLGSH